MQKDHGGSVFGGGIVHDGSQLGECRGHCIYSEGLLKGGAVMSGQKGQKEQKKKKKETNASVM